MNAPEAVHFGQDDLPFIDIGDGSKLKVLQVKTGEGLWIIENVFQAGYEVETHKHTGPVWGYTVSGAWKYKEYDYVNRAGSFLYEPAGSTHTLQCIEDDTRVWFQMYSFWCVHVVYSRSTHWSVSCLQRAGLAQRIIAG